jgi:hypothetical protein
VRYDKQDIFNNKVTDKNRFEKVACFMKIGLAPGAISTTLYFLHDL